MAELHSIVGIFHEDFPGISPWGGHLIKQDNSEIEGMLIDLYGPSCINGRMGKDFLEFEKQYGPENRHQNFHYSFKLKNGIYVGEYSSGNPLSNYSGKSMCKTNLFIPDTEFRQINLRTPEGYAKALTDSMIEQGLFEEFTDPKTGEKMIRLRE